jgi:hypothetical protein
MTAMYRKQYKQPWTFKKTGVVLLSEKEIIVLEEGAQLKNPMPHIITDQAGCSKYGVPESVAFDKWFDIIEPLQNQVISKFHLETTALGDTLLAGSGLSANFPAVTQDPATHNIYYFSGDFATGNIPFWSARLQGVNKLKGLLYSDRPDDPRRFFWLYYRPLMTGILTDYYTTMKSK